MTTFLQQGPLGQGVASANLPANTAVKWHTVAGQLAAAGVGDIPIGVLMDAVVSGNLGSFYRWGPGAEFYISATGVSAGDYLKCGAAGVLVQEGTPSVVTAATVGQAKTASDASNCVLMTATR